MATRLTCAAKTDVGLKRKNNEDNFVLVPSAGLYVLADGMGGHASGQVASKMCVTNLAVFICEQSRKPGFELPYAIKGTYSPEAILLANAIKYANERIYVQSCKDRTMEGMGTTVTAIFNSPRGLILAHVGDSRIYRLRHGKLQQMSRDHSLMNHLIDTGELKPEDADHFANKNVILRAVGLKDDVEVEIHEVAREQGDTYMMCSDGLSDIVSDADIEHVLATTPDLQEACNKLIALALKAGGKDNVTVVCVCVAQEDNAPAMMPGQSGAPGLRPAPMGKQVPSQPGIAAQGGSMPISPYMMRPSAGFSPMAMQPTPVHQGMAPVPMARPKMPAAMPTPVPMPPAQPVQPLRMHSVRQIVEPKQPSSPAMPKPIMMSGRTSSASMPAIPIKMHAGMDENPPRQDSFDSPQSQSGMHPTVQSGVHPLANPQAQQMPYTETVSAAQETALHEVNKISKEEQAMLPDTGLLLTAPPAPASSEMAAVSSPPLAKDNDSASEASSDLDMSSELMNSGDEVGNTRLDCPIVSDELLTSHSEEQCAEEAAEASSEARQLDAASALDGEVPVLDEEEDEDDDPTRIGSNPFVLTKSGSFLGGQNLRPMPAEIDSAEPQPPQFSAPLPHSGSGGFPVAMPPSAASSGVHPNSASFRPVSPSLVSPPPHPVSSGMHKAVPASNQAIPAPASPQAIPAPASPPFPPISSQAASSPSENAVSVSRGYVAPREAIEPPRDDYDDDSIEIGGSQSSISIFGEDDEEEETKLYRQRPDFSRNKDKW